MNNFLPFFTIPLSSYLLFLVLIPVLNKLAKRFNLIDKPNSRKLHSQPIPLTGGIGIVLSLALPLLLNTVLFEGFRQLHTVMAGALYLFVIGVLDDKTDLRASHKLLFQILVAISLTASGIRVESLYGLFGIYELPEIVQYLLSILLITGVVNAFNLMDGVDGLAGGLALLGLLMLTGFSWWMNEYALSLLFLSLASAVVGFLKHNLGKNKIFMGDAGSLFFGMLIVGAAIHLLNCSEKHPTAQPILLNSLLGFFSLPVLDSIRVYLARMKQGNSPFKADKSHLHHLLLLWGLSHKQVSVLICAFNVLMVASFQLIYFTTSLTTALLIAIVLFCLVGLFLNLHKKVQYWRNKIQQLENPSR